jgi:hypothetical protein
VISRRCNRSGSVIVNDYYKPVSGELSSPRFTTALTKAEPNMPARVHGWAVGKRPATPEDETVSHVN